MFSGRAYIPFRKPNGRLHPQRIRRHVSDVTVPVVAPRRLPSLKA